MTTASFYERHILPWLLHLSMKQSRLGPYRRRALATARGVILEVGAGSGLNFSFYGPGVYFACAIDLSPELLTMAKKRTRRTPPVLLVRASAESLPFRDRSFDTVVTTWTLCTIPDALKALREMNRVLRPAGHLL